MFTSHDWEQVFVLLIPKHGEGQGSNTTVDCDNELHPPQYITKRHPTNKVI
ncbi:hypothetical protein LINGRAHAP2_LOCUS9947, partial [Linum grandiflorum]